MHEIDILHTIVKRFGARVSHQRYRSRNWALLDRMYPVAKIAITLHRFVADRLESSLLRKTQRNICRYCSDNTVAVFSLCVGKIENLEPGFTNMRYKLNVELYINKKPIIWYLMIEYFSIYLFRFVIHLNFFSDFFYSLAMKILWTLQYSVYAILGTFLLLLLYFRNNQR